MFDFVCQVPDDWDQVKTSDVRKMSPTHSLLTTSNMIIGSLSKTVSNVTKAIGLSTFMSTVPYIHTFIGLEQYQTKHPISNNIGL